ncbi:MAG: hypothetical protein NUV77_25800 [Thermoguttaceae bacterium]|jgi:hypothetical protein|nr:hypothetical protein [Thermoguttaceae bacterium]
MALRLDRLRDARLWIRIAVLSAVTAGVLAASILVAWAISGFPGVVAATLAALACWLGASAAMVAGERYRAPRMAVAGFFAGMVFRIGVPLGLVFFARLGGGALFDLGLLYYLLVFYAVTLAVEIAMSLPKGSASDLLGKKP